MEDVSLKQGFLTFLTLDPLKMNELTPYKKKKTCEGQVHIEL